MSDEIASTTLVTLTSSSEALPTLIRPVAFSARATATAAASAAATPSASATASAASTTLKSSINWFVLLIILIPALFIVYAITKRILGCLSKRKEKIPPAPVHAPIPTWQGYPPMQVPQAAMMSAHLSPMQQMQWLAYQQHAPMQSNHQHNQWEKQQPYVHSWEK
ncbi:hypothetical protein BCR37DRAFT_393461 [Protomyces lactucae-debilis]|uniref:Uncharacterized protein n=1 Tax=Protomyces lactucae-debilis TaxID=2754530 RepID=A0A1Y2FA82_PROLT|nr:uncharacterized protein BCR37DRAFT_393461 [Protomyces lactucae-debilis]ORY80783.1 hypothetical protein BCR37DRAFT_393461 [Protomyces lactucae-debilis]